MVFGPLAALLRCGGFDEQRKDALVLNALIGELGSQFGLGDKADGFVRQTLAGVLGTQGNGLEAFLNQFEAVGLGSIARSWQGGMEGAQSISPAQLETALGQKGGLIAQLTADLGLSRQSVTPALGFVLPRLVGALTPDGKVGAVPAAVSAFLAGTAGVGAAATTKAAAAGTGSALVRWIPWLLLALLSLLLLGWCSKQNGEALRAPVDSQAMDAQEALALAQAQAAAEAALVDGSDAAAATEAEADAAPEGAGVVGDMVDGSPRLKVYFDVSKAEIAPDFAYAAAGLLQMLAGDEALKAQVSGFSDPTGNAEQNAALSKARAEAVRDALVAEGVALERIELVKPKTVELTEGNLAEARRVEVTVQQP